MLKICFEQQLSLIVVLTFDSHFDRYCPIRFTYIILTFTIVHISYIKTFNSRFCDWLRGACFQ